MASNWFEFKASAEAPESDLYLYGEVGGWGASAAEFISVLSERKDQHINLHIHSPGGSVFEGHAIYNALRLHPGGITTWVDGIAASMASVIAMAGRPVKIASNGFLMIHNPWGETAGGSDEMRKQADVLDKLKDSLVKIYADKSGMEPEEISAAMDSETWLNADEAVAFGLADEIFDGMKAAAKIDISAISAKAPTGVFEFAKYEREQPQEEKPMQPEETKNAVDGHEEMQDFQNLLLKSHEDFAQAQARITSLTAELDLANAMLVEAIAEREGFRAELEAERAKAASVAEQINAKATALVAAAGHAPVAIAAQNDDKIQPEKGSSILERFEELRKNKASTEWLTFLKTNRNEIIAAAKPTK